jgi:16S rRNA (cytosine967-C5)-methyltransferase
MARPQSANARVYAAEIVRQVIAGRSLDAALDETLAVLPPARRSDAALIQEMVYGTLRWLEQLQAVLALYLEKPLKNKDQDLFALLLVGLYQLEYMRTPKHAAVMETVAAAEDLNKAWAKNLLNAVLRGFLREPQRAQQKIESDPCLLFSHPPWLVDQIQRSWPEHWQPILTANIQRPPLTLRVNLLKRSRAAYLQELKQAGHEASVNNETDCGLTLAQPVPVTQLPGFAEGVVSVQDTAAQLAAILLDAQPGQRVLDACAAPGGKTGHVLERTPGADLVALDKDPQRLERVRQNLQRLSLSAQLMVGDAAKPQDWWDNRPFDRILADAPCSATGVIRRHPDIKIHRTPADIAALKNTQKQILEGLWPLLTHGGKLLYVTCSILTQENENQITRFLACHGDAAEIKLTVPSGIPRAVGQQILPGEQGMDGFYYACLQKH